MIITLLPVGSHLLPIVAATHNLNPSKLKGKASAICHRSMPEKERIPLTIDSYKLLCSPLSNPLPPRRSGSHLSRTPSKASPGQKLTSQVCAILDPVGSFQRSQSHSCLAKRVLVESTVFKGKMSFLRRPGQTSV